MYKVCTFATAGRGSVSVRSGRAYLTWVNTVFLVFPLVSVRFAGFRFFQAGAFYERDLHEQTRMKQRAPLQASM